MCFGTVYPTSAAVRRDDAASPLRRHRDRDEDPLLRGLHACPGSLSHSCAPRRLLGRQSLEQAVVGRLRFEKRHATAQVPLRHCSQDPEETFIHNHRNTFFSHCLAGKYVHRIWRVEHENDPDKASALRVAKTGRDCGNPWCEY